MNYELYMKSEIEKSLFVEITTDLIINNYGDNVLKKGEYPELPNDLVRLAKEGLDTVTPAMLLDGMLYMLACDKEFKYNKSYLEFFKEMKGIENYIILNINNAGKKELKRGLVYSTALTIINPKREYLYNRVLMLIALYEKLELEFLTEEIVRSLEELIELFPEFVLPHFHLGEYYLDKDMDVAKIHLRICIEDPELYDEATVLLRKIENTESFDEAVEFIKIGRGQEALDILLPICEEEEENFDAKYYAAVALRQIQDNPQALQFLRELTEFAERPEVYCEIALNIAELGDYATALVYFKKALKITPDDGGIICNMGACQYTLGQLEEAKKTFELASRINPEDEIAAKWLVKINADSTQRGQS